MNRAQKTRTKVRRRLGCRRLGGWFRGSWCRIWNLYGTARLQSCILVIEGLTNNAELVVERDGIADWHHARNVSGEYAECRRSSRTVFLRRNPKTHRNG